MKESIIKDIKSFAEEIKRISNLSKKRNYLADLQYYLADLQFGKCDFVKEVWNFLNKNKDDLLHITDITHIIFLLKKLIEFDPENKHIYQEFAIKMFKNYAELYANDIEFIFIPKLSIIF